MKPKKQRKQPVRGHYTKKAEERKNPVFATKGRIEQFEADLLESAAVTAALSIPLSPQERILYLPTMPGTEDYRLAKLVIPAKGSKDQRWYIVYYVLDPKTDELKRKRSYAINNHPGSLRERKKFAEKRLIPEINRKLVSGDIYTPQEDKDAMSLEVMVQKGLDLSLMTLKEGRSKTTRANQTKRFFEWIKMREMGHVHVTKFTKQMGYAYMDYLQSDYQLKNKRGNGKLSGWTLNNYYEAVNRIFNLLVQREYIVINPFQGIPRAKKKSTQNQVYTKGMQRELLEALGNYNENYLHYVKFMYYSLQRPSTIVSLQVMDVMKGMGDGIEWDDHIHFSVDQQKSGKRHVIPLFPQLKEILKERDIHNLPGNYYVFGKGGVPGPKMGDSIDYAEEHRKVVTSLKYGIEYTAYSWCHSGAVDRYLQNRDIVEIRDLKGHHSIKQTMDYLRDRGIDPERGAIRPPSNTIG